MTGLDRRLHAFRPDLADIRLKGRVKAPRFAEGKPAQIAVPVADVRSDWQHDAGLVSQLLKGDLVSVFDRDEQWSWVQAKHDGYVGYVPNAGLTDDAFVPTHIVTAPRTFVYGGADLKLPAVDVLSLGCALKLTGETETRGTRYLLLENGSAIIASHVLPVSAHTTGDHVAFAEKLINTPYLWGGTSAFGIDCSGLVQLSMRMAGGAVLRDTDMQAATIGRQIDPGKDGSGLKRGDLVFWDGHVGIMFDGDHLIHASGHSMLVCTERLSDAIERIGHLYGQPTIYRRP